MPRMEGGRFTGRSPASGQAELLVKNAVAGSARKCFIIQPLFD
jgi:hypothetical protein